MVLTESNTNKILEQFEQHDDLPRYDRWAFPRMAVGRSMSCIIHQFLGTWPKCRIDGYELDKLTLTVDHSHWSITKPIDLSNFYTNKGELVNYLDSLAEEISIFFKEEEKSGKFFWKERMLMALDDQYGKLWPWIVHLGEIKFRNGRYHWVAHKSTHSKWKGDNSQGAKYTLEEAKKQLESYWTGPV